VNISIVRAVEVGDVPGLEQDALKGCRLPAGFPLPVDVSTQELVEPIFDFLWAKLARRAKYVDNSAHAAADDLRDWYQYLDHFGLQAFEVSRADIENYSDLMMKLISPKTHERYSPKTVQRRVSTVISFYRHFNRAGMCEVDVGDSAELVAEQPDRRPGAVPA